MHETQGPPPEPSEPSPEPSSPEPSSPEPAEPSEPASVRTSADIDAANKADAERLAKEHAREHDSGTGVARSQ